MKNDVTPTRRHVVTAGAAATLGITATLSACSGSGSSTAAGSTSSGAAGGTAGGTGGATASSGAAGGASQGVPPTTVRAPSIGGAGSGQPGPLAKLSDVPVGKVIAAKGSDGTPIVIARPEEGKVVAFSAICTHRGCTVVPAGQKLTCPCHRSTFDAFTGARTAGPAPSALPAVTVKVDGEHIVAG